MKTLGWVPFLLRRLREVRTYRMLTCLDERSLADLGMDRATLRFW